MYYSISETNHCVSTNKSCKTKTFRKKSRCLDVRSNDNGDLVVTKGDQYDVREASDSSCNKGSVRNLGKPVDLCERYYNEVNIIKS